ncbi:hypothetical protein OIU74_014079 [Salix koriyanagi]|uniref:EGF-like calcium-binding domain-containing protein n=1 Tax=Salix koriyanagi TaxID=2511006 RepID=A0A9Q0PV07_9ROSI|nr:hypothetical protein OIU74_014079 [Salix koriyanagi]
MQVVKLVSHISFLLLPLMFQPATAKSPPRLAKPNCPDRCGNISIPYPFGIGKDCYMDESFDVKCNETSTPPRAFLRRIDMELVNITLTGGALVKGPVIPVESLGRHEVLPLNLAGTPFFLFYNYFIAVGCNTRASLWRNYDSTEHTVCDSICSNGSSINNIILENGDCSGEDCCQAMGFPSFLQVFNTSLESIEGKQGSDGQNLAFLADRQWFDSKIKSPQDINNLPNTTVPVSLAWLRNSSWPNIEDTVDCNFRFLINSTTISTHNCSCPEGYEGNPYLQCTDVDECEDRNSCHGLTRCVNTKGSYKCGLHPLRVTALGTTYRSGPWSSVPAHCCLVDVQTYQKKEVHSVEKGVFQTEWWYVAAATIILKRW